MITQITHYKSKVAVEVTFALDECTNCNRSQWFVGSDTCKIGQKVCVK